ncbi:P-loop NTPase fold protein [Vibrio sp. PID17_43]|uniref:KAP family P-loop NTPase fold protein n=1 Tax=Vibrio sp. PID17_43 TaxID=1583451 RepID=UPI0015575E4C|nr:KAP family NTPase [Vibrio sp. PID17_43]
MNNITFTDRDEFKRETVAEKVALLLESSIDISPMVVDGGWGTGKTEFCHKLINLMKGKDSHHLIYVDAFQADHADEPLLTILAEILKVLPEGEQRESFVQKVLPTVRYGLKTLAKAGVAHVLKQDTKTVLDGFDKEIQKVADKAIDSSVESLLKDHIKANESLEALQKMMADITEEKPIVVFIDELDRCRPDFAVNILEVIKHTFPVSGVQFVLVTNTSQLKASINHRYGDSVDAQQYLDKFLKFTFTLPNSFSESTGYTKSLASVHHYRNLMNQSPILGALNLAENSEFSFISHIIKVRHLSLREVETLVRYIEIYQQLSGEGALDTDFGYRLLRLFGIVLFCFNKEIASSLTQSKADAKQIAEYLGEHQIVPIHEGGLNAEHHQVVLTMIAQECFYNSALFKAEEGHHESEWEQLITQYFIRGGFPPREGERSKIVVEAIQTLNLM